MARSGTLRILFETDAPYMVPSNLYTTFPEIKGKLPLSHSAMIPWTADFVCNTANEAVGEARWDVARVLDVGRVNAKHVYGV